MSSRRRVLALAVLSLSGCFSDEGATLTQPATSIAPGTTTDTVGTTAGPATTTTEVTTDAPDPTTGTGGPTTGAPTTHGTTDPLCPGAIECDPGDVMVTDLLCDPCGRIHRTCQPDCTWGGDECVLDLSSCAYWYYDAAWTRVALPAPAPEHAPAAPAIAAFELAQHGRIFVLTADSYHVLQASDHTWIASGPLTGLLPGLPGQLLQAYTVPEGGETYTLTVVGDPQAWLYTLPAAGYQASLVQTSPCCDSWTDLVNPGSQAAVRDIFVDLDAPFPWTAVDFYAPCVDDTVFLGRYAAWVTATDVYVQDVDYCFEMVYPASHAQFAPLAAPGAPPGALLGGLALLGERLYVFPGE